MKKGAHILLILATLLLASITSISAYASQDSLQELWDAASTHYEAGQWQDAIKQWYLFRKELDTPRSDSDQAAMRNIALSHYYWGVELFNDENYKDAILKLELAAGALKENVSIQKTLAQAHLILKNYGEAMDSAEDALEYATSSSEREDIQKIIDQIKAGQEYTNNLKNAPFDDPLGPYQWYLNHLDIYEAKTTIGTVKYIPIVAVIDDGVHLDHPDLHGRFWTNTDEIPGNERDDDNNGYVDDFNGWDFIKKTNASSPNGSHGTSVAGLIAANYDNEVGIVGIANEVRIMPIAVCTQDSCPTDVIPDAIRYAVDNGADFINLSVGIKNSGTFRESYDAMFDYALQNGVAVIVGGGNGDVFSDESNGVNTSINKVSFACNARGKDGFFSVGATGEDGEKTDWTNYGDCVDIYIPGEKIQTLAVPVFYKNGDEYITITGTSFSAPILTGIMALGYNLKGRVDLAQIQSIIDTLMANDPYSFSALEYVKEIALTKTTTATPTTTTAKTTTTTATTNIYQDPLLSAQYLAQKNIIVSRANTYEYKISNNILRQEIIGTILKFSGTDVPWNRPCMDYFNDVSKSVPNTWICRSAETAADIGMITRANTRFNPESFVTNAEALAMIFDAKNLDFRNHPIDEYSYHSGTQNWQKYVIYEAYKQGLIYSPESFDPNGLSSRGEVFQYMTYFVEKEQ